MGIIIGILFLSGLGVAVVTLYVTMRRRQPERKGRKSSRKLHGMSKQIHTIHVINFTTFAGSLVYGNYPGDIEIANASLLEASVLYEEVADNPAEISGDSTGHKNDQQTGATHAAEVPTMLHWSQMRQR